MLLVAPGRGNEEHPQRTATCSHHMRPALRPRVCRTTNSLAVAALHLDHAQPSEPGAMMDMDSDGLEQLQAPWAAGAFSAVQQQALAHALGIGALAWDHIQQSWVRHQYRVLLCAT